jgi:hypothetical protein
MTNKLNAESSTIRTLFVYGAFKRASHLKLLLKHDWIFISKLFIVGIGEKSTEISKSDISDSCIYPKPSFFSSSSLSRIDAPDYSIQNVMVVPIP